MKKQVRDCIRSPWSTIAHLLMRYVFALSLSLVGSWLLVLPCLKLHMVKRGVGVVCVI